MIVGNVRRQRLAYIFRQIVEVKVILDAIEGKSGKKRPACAVLYP